MKKSTKMTLQAIGAALACLALDSCASPQSHTKAVPYPFKNCLVSGNELGSMGDVVTETYDGREIKFCCKPCVKKFHAAPEKYLSKLRQSTP